MRLLRRKFRFLRIAFVIGSIDLVLIIAYVIWFRLG